MLAFAMEHPFITFFIVLAVCETLSDIFGKTCKDCHTEDEESKDEE